MPIAGSAAGANCPWGHTYLPAHGPGVRAGIETMAPALVGIDPRGIDHLNAVMDVTFLATPMPNRRSISPPGMFSARPPACRSGGLGEAAAVPVMATAARPGGGQFLDLHQLA